MSDDLNGAIADLEKAEAENERLRAALEEIAWHNPKSPEAAIARQALGR